MKIETKFDIVYRIVTNTKCNDFNEEPEYRIVAYYIDYKNNIMTVKGWSWGDGHKIINDYYKTKEEAEKKLEEIQNGNK